MSQSSETTPTPINSEWPWPDELDAAIAAPESHEILLEDEKTRVVKVSVAPETKEPVHTHKNRSVMIVLNSTNLAYYDEKGTRIEIPVRVDVSPEKPFVEYMEPEGPHAVENLDGNPYYAIRIEFKEHYSSEAVPQSK